MHVWPMSGFIFLMNFVNVINLDRNWDERLYWEDKWLLIDSAKHLRTHVLNSEHALVQDKLENV